MSLAKLINRPCVLHRETGAVTTDIYGNEKRAPVDIATVCEIQQRERSEEDDQELGAGEWIGFFPAGTELSTGDSVTVEGLGDFEVVGPPAPLRNPRTRIESHVGASLNQTKGAGDS